MNIYKLNGKDLKMERKKFNGTAYGQTVFLLANLFTIVNLVFFVMILICSIFCNYGFWCLCLTPMVIFFLITTILSYILGTIYYYNKLEVYVNSKK